MKFIATICFALVLLLLVGRQVVAQNIFKRYVGERDWIDSLAVRYRADFIRYRIDQDKIILDSLTANLEILRANEARYAGRNSRANYLKVKRAFMLERRSIKGRLRAYKRELRSARTDFTMVKSFYKSRLLLASDYF